MNASERDYITYTIYSFIVMFISALALITMQFAAMVQDSLKKRLRFIIACAFVTLSNIFVIIQTRFVESLDAERKALKLEATFF